MRTSRRPCGTCTTANRADPARASLDAAFETGNSPTERLTRPVSDRASQAAARVTRRTRRALPDPQGPQPWRSRYWWVPFPVLYARFARPSVPRRSPPFGAPIGAHHRPPDRVRGARSRQRVADLRPPPRRFANQILARWQPDCSGAYESRVRHADATRQAAGGRDRDSSGRTTAGPSRQPTARGALPPVEFSFALLRRLAGYGASDAAGEGGRRCGFARATGLRSHPRSWAERAYLDNLIHYNKLDRGGHFAAWEQPQLFTDELRAGFRSLRA